MTSVIPTREGGLQKGAVFQKLVLASGVVIGISFVLYSISVIVLIGGELAQIAGLSSSGTSAPLNTGPILLSLIMLIVLGISIIKVSFDWFRGKLRNGIIMLPCVFACLYLLLQGASLLADASGLDKIDPVQVASLANDATLIIAAGVLILIAAPLILHRSQSVKIIGASFGVAIAVLIAIYINDQATVLGVFGEFFYPYSFLSSIPIATPQSFNPTSLPLSGLFLAISWAEMSSIIIASVGILLWSILYHREQVMYAVLVPFAGVLVYGVGLAISGFQSASYLLNYASQNSGGSNSGITGGTLDAYNTLFVSRIEFLSVSLLIAGVAGILIIAATGLGLGIRAQLLLKKLPRNVTQSANAAGPSCPKCGAPVRAGDGFCRFCGAKFY